MSLFFNSSFFISAVFRLIFFSHSHNTVFVRWLGSMLPKKLLFVLFCLWIVCCKRKNFFNKSHNRIRIVCFFSFSFRWPNCLISLLLFYLHTFVSKFIYFLLISFTMRMQFVNLSFSSPFNISLFAWKVAAKAIKMYYSVHRLGDVHSYHHVIFGFDYCKGFSRPLSTPHCRTTPAAINVITKMSLALLFSINFK